MRESRLVSIDKPVCVCYNVDSTVRRGRITIKTFFEPQLAHPFPYHIQYFTLPSFPAHWHTETEIFYVQSGRVLLTVSERQRMLTDRMLAVAGCSEVHAIDSVEPGSRVLVIKFGYDLLGARYDTLVSCDYSRLPMEFNRLPDNTPLERELLTLGALSEVFNSPGGQKNAVLDLRIRASLNVVAAELVELGICLQGNGGFSRQGDSKLAIQRVQNYVGTHFTTPITLDQAVALSGFEKTRFCELFRAETGMSFHEYLNRCRIRSAKTLLAFTDKPVSFVAEAVGIPEAKTFTRLFRAYEGMTPTAWKAKQRE
ncbi:MAG: AraC family transcriptional regulator [Clostridia bacterium]|nr:AraC family transcriptional regulator [Clostridia bacterium]